MKRLLYILLTAIISTAATSCNDDDEYYQYGDFRFDMVTFVGQDGNASGDTYINYPADDITPVTMIDQSAAASTAGGLDSGDRILLNYIVDSRNSDGSLNITARSYTRAITDTLRMVPTDTSVPMDSINLNSIWRTGKYINIYCRVRYTEYARIMALVADYTTFNDDTVHCYLMHNMMQAPTYFWRRCYMSFDISSVWNLQSCKTVRVHINDVAYPELKYYDFTKTN